MKSSASKICHFLNEIYENCFFIGKPKAVFINIIICPNLFQHRPQSIDLGGNKVAQKEKQKKQIPIFVRIKKGPTLKHFPETF